MGAGRQDHRGEGRLIRLQLLSAGAAQGVVTALANKAAYEIAVEPASQSELQDALSAIQTAQEQLDDLRAGMLKRYALVGELALDGSVRAVKEATGAPFLLHREELELARSAGAMAERLVGARVENPPDPDAFLEDADTLGIEVRTLGIIKLDPIDADLDNDLRVVG